MESSKIGSCAFKKEAADIWKKRRNINKIRLIKDFFYLLRAKRKSKSINSPVTARQRALDKTAFPVILYN
jgi:hypothetical protein